MAGKLAAYIVTAGVMTALGSRAAFAQSTISGQVKDASGAAMPGVTVEAASSALIEGSRASMTSGDGRYSIVDVRPGAYTMTFTLPGFTTVERHVEVRSNVTVPVDVEMTVGSIQETITVAGAIATVDVQNVAHPETLSREELDSIPTARNLQSLASSVPGIHLNIPEVGGSQQIQQTYMATHGNPHHHEVVFFDGLLINGMLSDGQVQPYVDDASIQQTTYSTVGNAIDIASGGVFANIVPKDGGNAWHADSFDVYTPSSFVGTNLDSTLLARGISTQAAVTQIRDFDGSVGGPIRKNKLWFLASGRAQRTDVQSPLCKDVDGTPCVERDHIYTGHIRLTSQLNAVNKLSAMFMRDVKKNESEVVTNAQVGTGVPATPNAASQRPVWINIAQAKWRGILSPKLLLDAGFSLNTIDFNVIYQDGLTQVPFSPAWYSNVMLTDTVQNLRNNVSTMQTFWQLDRYHWQAGGTYVGGDHQIRFGVQDSRGPAYQRIIMNGDLYANEASGVPTNVTVFNTPVSSQPYLNADLGLYVQDTWTMRRLTLTPGLRWEYLSNGIRAESADAGRFVPARDFPAVTCDTNPGISCFANWVPRLGVVYDLFGTHKTAVKASLGKYNAPLVSGNLATFNPMAITSQSRAWINTGGCTGQACFPTDAQIGPAPSAGFGTLTPRSVDPNFRREYNVQFTLGVQHEIRNGLALNVTWIRRSDYQQRMTVNQAVPASAWTPTTITNPLDGSPITIYNLNPSSIGVTPVLYQTNAPTALRANTYNGLEMSVFGRLPRGAFLSAGWTIDREQSRQCDQNIGTNSLNDPNSLRYCDWYGNLYQDLGSVGSLPYRNDFKLQGNFPLWSGFEFGFSMYSAPAYNTSFALNNQPVVFPMQPNSEPVFAAAQQGFKEVYWTLTSSTKYPANCVCANPGGIVDAKLAQGSETVLLVAPGSRLTPQLTQLDVAVRRVFTMHNRVTMKIEAQIFNLLNSNVVTAEAQTLGSSVTPFVEGGVGGVPTSILNPRMLRTAVQLRF